METESGFSLTMASLGGKIDLAHLGDFLYCQKKSGRFFVLPKKIWVIFCTAKKNLGDFFVLPKKHLGDLGKTSREN